MPAVLLLTGAMALFVLASTRARPPPGREEEEGAGRTHRADRAAEREAKQQKKVQ